MGYMKEMVKLNQDKNLAEKNSVSRPPMKTDFSK